MPADRKLRVFLCHASEDKPIVRELYQRLLAEDWIDPWLDPWLDEEKLLPGQDWDLEIKKALEKSDVVLVCLSSNTVMKEGYVHRELRLALDVALEKPEGTIFIIPLRLGECELPRPLGKYQYVDYFPESRRQGSYQRLLEGLRRRADGFVPSTAKHGTASAISPPASIIQYCSHCAGILRRTDNAVRCVKCGALYHWHCWSFEGRCANCGSREYKKV